MRMIKDKEEEPEEVVELIKPDWSKDEEELNENSSKGENATI